MSKQATPKHAVTPPKGRPTRSRHDLRRPEPVFGSTLRWSAATAVLVLAFIVLFVVAG